MFPSFSPMADKFFAKLESLHFPDEKAFWVLTHHQPIFDNAYRFSSADSRAGKRYSTKRPTGVFAKPRDDDRVREELGASISDFYRAKGKGEGFQVDILDRSGVIYYFIYLEDVPRSGGIFQQGKYQKEILRDSFEVVFWFPRAGNYRPAPGAAVGASPADAHAKFPSFRFDDAAQEIFIEWSRILNRERLPREEEPLIQQHLAKYEKLFPALALLFHLVECAAQGICGPVSVESAQRAADWCAFLEAHARRCYGLLLDDGLRAAQTLVRKLEQGALKGGFTLRDIRRHQWRHLTTDDSVQAALDWLESEGWLRGEATGGTGPGSGRRTIRYSIHPKIAGRQTKAQGDDHFEPDTDP